MTAIDFESPRPFPYKTLDTEPAPKVSAPSVQTASIPTLDQEITFLSGVDSNGNVAPISFFSWNRDNPATYDPTHSIVSKWALNGQYSQAGTPGGVVNYYYDPSANWSAGEKDIFASGLDLWAAVANVSFKQTTNPADAQITFTRNNDRSAGQSETDLVFWPQIGFNYLPEQIGDQISIDTSVRGWDQLDSFSHVGGYGVETVLHEEGHALGLGHEGPYNGNVVPSQQFSPYDTRQWSIMSYLNPTSNLPYAKDNAGPQVDYNGHYPTTWQPVDIMAIQRLYGVAQNTPLSGGQVFGFNTNITGDIQKFFDFTINKDPVITLWDKGQNNTLDLSGYSTPSTVNLNPLGFSSFDNMKNNLVIAADTSINKAIGGAGNDVFITNGASDFIDGGAGQNEADFSKTFSDYTITQAGSFIDVATRGTDIISQLKNIQILKFNDQSVNVSKLFPVSSTLSSVNAAEQSTFLPVLDNITNSSKLTALPPSSSAASIGLAAQGTQGLSLDSLPPPAYRVALSDQMQNVTTFMIPSVSHGA